MKIPQPNLIVISACRNRPRDLGFGRSGVAILVWPFAPLCQGTQQQHVDDALCGPYLTAARARVSSSVFFSGRSADAARFVQALSQTKREFAPRGRRGQGNACPSRQLGRLFCSVLPDKLSSNRPETATLVSGSVGQPIVGPIAAHGPKGHPPTKLPSPPIRADGKVVCPRSSPGHPDIDAYCCTRRPFSSADHVPGSPALRGGS